MHVYVYIHSYKAFQKSIKKKTETYRSVYIFSYSFFSSSFEFDGVVFPFYLFLKVTVHYLKKSPSTIDMC